MSAIATFDNPLLGTLKIFKDEKGREYYRAIDVCSILRLANPSKILKLHVSGKYIFQFNDGTNRAGLTNYLSEPGVYQLIFKSKTELAEKFQEWVFEEVLPKLRSSGGYIMPNATTEQLAALKEEITEKELKLNKLKASTTKLVDELDDQFTSTFEYALYGCLQTGVGNAVEVTRTFSQFIKELRKLKFYEYDNERLKIAFDLFNDKIKEVGGFNFKLNSLTDKTSIVDESNLKYFAEAVYHSMRYDGNINDSDTSCNMLQFEKLFGLEFGAHTKREGYETVARSLSEIKTQLE